MMIQVVIIPSNLGVCSADEDESNKGGEPNVKERSGANHERLHSSAD